MINMKKRTGFVCGEKMKRKETAYIKEKKWLAEGIVSMRLSVSFAALVKAGQFVSLFVRDTARLLPRPISIADADAEAGTIRLVFRVAGEGTRQIAAMEEGEALEVLGPLGNGFPLEAAAGKTVILAAGGIGIPPMLLTAKQLLCTTGARPQWCTPALCVHADGWRNEETFLLDDLRETGNVLIATDDGSVGVHGTVIDALTKWENECTTGARPLWCNAVIFACGPKPMLRALKEFAAERDVPLYVSMEERMACGVGVCLGCVTKTAGVDDHSKVCNARVCTDGPVFDARDVVL